MEPTRVIACKAFYADGNVYTSKDYKWGDIPDDGVVALLLFQSDTDRFNRPIRVVRHGSDWYFSDGNQLFGSNSDPDYINQRRYEGCSFKRGKWIGLDKYNQLLATVRDDYELP